MSIEQVFFVTFEVCYVCNCCAILLLFGTVGIENNNHSFLRIVIHLHVWLEFVVQPGLMWLSSLMVRRHEAAGATGAHAFVWMCVCVCVCASVGGRACVCVCVCACMCVTVSFVG